MGLDKGCSTVDAIIKASENWRAELDHNKSIAVAFLGLSKAFYSINLTILIEKVSCFDNMALKLI